eukprot:m.77674 g.77674  ORF g.77674 m.77674 type:complete len:514 (+) comp36053_c0_seq3:67-1608(+)
MPTIRILILVLCPLAMHFRPLSSLTCSCSNCLDATNCSVLDTGACFAHFEAGNETSDTEVSRGCTAPEHVIFVCLTGHTAYCCSNSDYCNEEWSPTPPLFPQRNTSSPNAVTDKLSPMVLITTGVTALIVVSLLGGLTVTWRLAKRRRQWRGEHVAGAGDYRACLERSFPDVSVSLCYPTSRRRPSFSSGSGAGIPRLAQRTIALQIRLISILGKGRFAEVWKAMWKERAVAVKVFNSWEEESWAREVKVYNSPMLRHDNILGFVGADVNSTGLQTQLWLVFDYHPCGSLSNHLHNNVLSLLALHRLAVSAASGLAHLHLDVAGQSGKPAIAHRDLKSRNILVKMDGTCAIADLGLAVCNEPGFAVTLQNMRSGTRRYMAPEVLDQSINSSDFNAFLMADVYSYGLILWEMTRRCCAGGVPRLEYQAPYYDLAPNDPSYDEMNKLVCENKVRPDIDEKWQEHEALRVFVRLMQESWNENSLARLTAQRVKKTLERLGEELPKKETEILTGITQ